MTAAAAGFNVAMLPYPLWFKIRSLLFITIGIFIGARLGLGQPSGPDGIDIERRIERHSP